MKDENNKKVSELASIFYRNGFGGATLLESTLPNHQHDEWDRIPQSRKSEVKEGLYHSFLKPHQSFDDLGEIESFQQRLWDSISMKVRIVTED